MIRFLFMQRGKGRNCHSMVYCGINETEAASYSYAAAFTQQLDGMINVFRSLGASKLGNISYSTNSVVLNQGQFFPIGDIW